jgi:hypothetical protein
VRFGKKRQMSTEQLSETQNENMDWSRDTPWWELIRRSLMAAFGSYRPELHDMRGRGPKWREKALSWCRGLTG